MTLPLNSFDDFSPLKEIIVGSANGYRDHLHRMSFDTFISDNLTGTRGYYASIAPWAGPADPKKQIVSRDRGLEAEFVEELIEDVELLASTLLSAGVKVMRPLEAEYSTPVRTLSFDSVVTPPLNLRDNTLILGDQIVETPPTLRARYFETALLSKIFLDYFREGARWATMPRPRMTNASFDPDIVRNPAPNIEFPVLGKNSLDVGIEMMVDAANVMRLGRDLFFNVANRNHQLAYQWLSRHLDGEIRTHKVDNVSQSHVDSVFVALRPGTLLVRNLGVMKFLPDMFASWEILVAPEPSVDDYPQYKNDYPIPASPYIDMNVLSIDEARVLVNEACVPLIQLLEHAGFDVIPVRHRHRRLFGGGFHCFTLDTVRTGGRIDYFS